MRVMCLSVNGKEATPYFGAPTPFWSSRPHLEISRLQLYPSHGLGNSQFTSSVHSILHRHFFTFLTFVFFECMTVIDRRMSDLMQTHISNSYQIYFHILGMHRNENFCLTPNKMKHWPNTVFRGIFPMYFDNVFNIT